MVLESKLHYRFEFKHAKMEICIFIFKLISNELKIAENSILLIKIRFKINACPRQAEFTSNKLVSSFTCPTSKSTKYRVWSK